MQCEIEINNTKYVKHQNRSVVSSMNNMKDIIEEMDKYYPSENEAYEKLINQTPFKYLSQRCPAEVYLSSVPSQAGG